MSKYWFLILVLVFGSGGLSVFSQYPFGGSRSPGSGGRSFIRGGHNLAGYGHFRHEYTKEDSGMPDQPDSMGLTRLRLNLSGLLQPDLAYLVEYDFRNSMMTDALIQLKHLPYYDWTLTIGQFKIPFSEAGRNFATPYQELIKGPLIYEARYLTSTTISDREIGLMVEGEMLERKGVYVIGIFNGTGINMADDNDHKDLLLHFRVSPWKEERASKFKPLEFGASIIKGAMSETDPATMPGVDLREKYCYTMKYEIEKTIFTYEQIYQDIGIDGPRDRTAKNWYVQATRDFGMDFFKRRQKVRAIARYEYYDNDSLVEDDEIKCVTLGGNWFVNKYLRLQINYNSFDETAGIDSEEWLFQLELKF